MCELWQRVAYDYNVDQRKLKCKINYKSKKPPCQPNLKEKNKLSSLECC